MVSFISLLYILLSTGYMVTSSFTTTPPTKVEYSSTQISPAPAYYPRMFMLTYPNNTQVAAGTVSKITSGSHRIVFVIRTSNTPEIFTELTNVIDDTSGDPSVDLDNGYTFQMPNGTLICGYRYHIGNNSQRLYRIQTSISNDYGNTWSPASTIIEGPIGVWEPFIYRTSYDENYPNNVHVAYSAELTNGGIQDIVIQNSTDGGFHWMEQSRIHTDGSRNGMPGIVELFDHSLVAIFEGFWTDIWGHFTVNSARSFDGGLTWPQREIVHTPPSAGFGPNGHTLCSGSPQINICPDTGKIVVVYMTNEPNNGSQPWPAGASLGSVSAHLNYSNPAQLLNWTLVPEAIIPITTKAAYWPSFLSDPQDPLRKTSTKNGKGIDYSMRIAYQGDDSAAYITDSTVCID